MQESKFLIHGNGKEKPPTGFMFEKEQMKGLYFNQSPAKVCRTSAYILTFHLKTGLLEALELVMNSKILELKNCFIIFPLFLPLIFKKSLGIEATDTIH